ncbi:MAG: hypothetical protein KKF62_11525 [Bacteroidetes bacterium]|nr:hypothetical protein [Bacteroidota bacterium]MBU1116809.1 hypothetical protein [Bacteroidota bacterium]MBU1799428.1 hypothetical protein [Bacteroidota bacterium]
MKKLLLLIFLVPILLFGQHNGAAINFGYFNPSATDGGFMLGYKGEKFVDRNLSLGWSVGWFHKQYVDQVLLSEAEKYYGVLDGSITEKKATSNMHSVPIMASLTSYFPLLPIVDAFVTGSLGFEGLLISYNNLQNENDNELKTAWDFAWEIGTGISYKLGNRSDFYGEISYHNSNPSWNFKVNDPNTGVSKSLEQSFDMSGVAVKFGFKFLW